MVPCWFSVFSRLGAAVCALALTVSAQNPPARPAEPLTIEQAVSEALAHNLSLLAQRYSVSIAEAAKITARLRPNPVVSLSADHLDLLGTGFNSTNNGGPPEYAIRTDILLERGHKRAYRMDLAEAGRYALEAEVLNAARSVVLDVENAFIDLRLAKDSLELAGRNQAAFEEIVTLNTVRVRSGDLPEVELLRARVAAAQSLNQVYQSRLRLRTVRNRLLLLLGRTQGGESLDAAGDLRADPGPPSLDDLLARAIGSRPDLEAARRTHARSQAELQLQIAQAKVDYTVGAEYRRQDAVSGRGNSLGFFVQANLPVLNRNQGEIERVRRELQQQAARFRELEAGVRTEVANAFEQFQTAKTLLHGIETDMLKQARDVREITRYSYRRGGASLIEFLDAQRAFNDTMQSYNEARAEYARSLYLLDATTGQTPRK
ncbi:MAG: TolC family protein [Acidobacteria bacterium]|nr:TolC family protein [Acidobacteriota bacterium]